MLVVACNNQSTAASTFAIGHESDEDCIVLVGEGEEEDVEEDEDEVIFI